MELRGVVKRESEHVIFYCAVDLEDVIAWMVGTDRSSRRAGLAPQACLAVGAVRRYKPTEVVEHDLARWELIERAPDPLATVGVAEQAVPDSVMANAWKLAGNGPQRRVDGRTGRDVNGIESCEPAEGSG